MQVIAFLTNGGQGIGMGHIIRCCALGQELKKSGCKVFFFSALKEGINSLKKQGFDVECLKTVEPFNAKEVTGFIIEKKVDILVVDSYSVSQDYFNQMKKVVKRLVYIDDINAFDYNVDILINYSISAKKHDYKNLNREIRILLGPQYALLRKQFQNIPFRKMNESVSRIMITSGAADKFDTIPLIIKAILEDDELKDKEINVIIGNSFNNTEIIKDFSSQNKNIILHQNISDLSDIMLSSDIAISAGGSTLYELCACGIPSLSYIIAGNQEKSAQALSEQGIIECMGWHNKLSTNMISKKIKELCNDYEKRKELSLKMQKLVDGRGAQRVAEEIVRLV